MFYITHNISSKLNCACTDVHVQCPVFASLLVLQGASLEVPEIVPFRLTHNLVDALGPTKYEGVFRRACEVTMNVLRQQREPLMR